jgi:protein-S-isoprenylcysteine O-methyltransferase Ste14
VERVKVKAISSSIVVAAGIYGIVNTPPFSEGLFLFALLGLAAGIITLALGLVGWWASLKFDR